MAGEDHVSCLHGDKFNQKRLHMLDGHPDFEGFVDVIDFAFPMMRPALDLDPLARPGDGNLLRRRLILEEIGHAHIEPLGQFEQGGHGRHDLISLDFSQYRFGKSDLCGNIMQG